MSYRSVLVSAMSWLFSANDPRDAERRLLAVGGIHVFDSQPPCRLLRAQPGQTVEDLGWADTLALEAKGEGHVEVDCGPKTFMLEIKAPVRLEIALLDNSRPAEIAVHERFKVRATLYDEQGRELEVGKFTHFQWTAAGILEIANDRSAGEFGFCDTCYGMQGFRAVQPGEGSLTASLNSLQGTLMVTAKPLQPP